ncbi:MAG: helix-turn-helix domain-containing protein [Bacteroidia bacterium]|nr:helix-turn-helix domain-containing protein [Bacteroidia bacterium]
MAQIKNEKQYRMTLKRIDELLLVTDDDTPLDDKNIVELELLSDLVEEYEDVHYPIGTPTLTDVIKLRMYEMNLTQAKLSEMLGVSPSRVSDYLTGKCEPTMKVARIISQKLDISSDIVLGV